MSSASLTPGSNLSRWYSEDSSGVSSNVNVFGPANTAFEQALEIFKQKLTRDPKKTQRIESFQATSLVDVLKVVDAAQKHYESKHTGSKAWRCITELSKRICHYGNVMDVMVQHHPEYVSLAWGAMKMLFGAIVEHENLGTTIVSGLCDVADALPQIELAAILFPTSFMKQAVASLYAYIMKFLIRALEWYEEGRIAHIVHSITKPAALRYDDLIKEIRKATSKIADSAAASSHAEQRDMHDELRDIRGVVDTAITTKDANMTAVQNKLNTLNDLIKQLRAEILLDQSINASARIELRHTLSDIQLTQALSMISSACSVDHQSSFQAALIRRDKRRMTTSKGTPFWLSTELQSWDAAQCSSSILLKALFKDRNHVRDLCTNIIEQLSKARTTVLWALKDKDQTYSVTETLKSLVYQALRLDYSSNTDLLFSFQLRKFLDARIEGDYVNLLVDILRHFRLVYIIFESEVLKPCSAPQCRLYFHQLSRRLSERGAKTVLKVMVLTYGAGALSKRPEDNLVLKVGRTSRRKGKKLPAEPLRNVNGALRQPMRKLGSRSCQMLRGSGTVVRV